VNIEAFTKLLQLSISPIVVISAVGLLLLSVTNRLGRAIDRARALVKELDEGGGNTGESRGQLRVIVRRCGLLRFSISLIIGSIFASCMMILLLFALIFWGAPVEVAILTVFGLNIACLLGSVLGFLADIWLSLSALKIVVARHLSPESPNARPDAEASIL